MPRRATSAADKKAKKIANNKKQNDAGKQRYDAYLQTNFTATSSRDHPDPLATSVNQSAGNTVTGITDGLNDQLSITDLNHDPASE